MGKDAKNVVHGESFSRINYLYQAAHAALIATPHNLELVRFYIQSLKTIARKNVLRLDPSMKRTLCKKCMMLLVPGVTASIRLKSKRQKHVSVRCLDCSTVKRFVCNKEYKLWCEQREAWVYHVPAHVTEQAGYQGHTSLVPPHDREQSRDQGSESKGPP